MSPNNHWEQGVFGSHVLQRVSIGHVGNETDYRERCIAATCGNCVELDCIHVSRAKMVTIKSKGNAKSV